MKGFILLIVMLLLTSCAKWEEFAAPQPHHLLQHSGWFDERRVSVCGWVKHGQNSCTLEVCRDGSTSCANPVSVWISTKQLSCYTRRTQKVAPAIVRGRFFSLESETSFVLASAEVKFVEECVAKRRRAGKRMG